MGEQEQPEDSAEEMGKQKQPEDSDEKLYESLINQHYDTQKTYDKMVITFSGGALSLSLVFKKTIGLAAFPFISWYFWLGSLVVLLLSMYLSTISYRRAILNFDKEESSEYMGGIWDKINLFFLNPLGGLLFILGLVFFIFCYIP